jgi:hypothetical protein
MGKISIKMVGFVIVVFALVIGVGALYRFFTMGVRVCIRNESQRRINIVDIYYRGGSTGPIGIDAGNSYEVEAHPSGKSDLTVRYIDRRGTQVYQPIDTYLLPYWRGTIEITIDANDVITTVHRNPSKPTLL